jgi:hypothetical protein
MERVMKLEIIIDGMFHGIDSTDPEILGKWMVEIFGRVRHPTPATPATYFQVRAQPSYIPDADGNPTLDWIADSRFLGTATARTPREMVAALSAWLDEWEAARD